MLLVGHARKGRVLVIKGLKGMSGVRKQWGSNMQPVEHIYIYTVYILSRNFGKCGSSDIPTRLPTGLGHLRSHIEQ